VIEPSGSKCQVGVDNSLETAPADGGTGTLTITAERDCPWTASASAPWITVTSDSGGQGAGTLTFRVAPNVAPSRRTGTLGVNDLQVSVSQEPAPCTYRVSQSTSAVSAAGGEVTLGVEAMGGCAWTAVSDAPWIQVVSGAQGNGGGSARLLVQANTGVARTGAVRVAGQTITVTQANAITCATSLTPAAQNMPAEGGTAVVSVASPAACGWTAASDVEWIAIANGASGTGPGQVSLSISPNPSIASRQGAIAIGNQTFAVTQAGVSCSYSITPPSDTVPPRGESTTVAVTTAPGCSWTASAGVSWIAVTTGAAGSGSGSVTLSVSANSTGTRIGTARIAGQTFTVTQTAASCTYAIAPRNHAAGSAAGTGTVSVTSAGHCAWTAVSNVSWLTVTSGASGTGNGTVRFGVTANTGAERTGRLTIGGQTLTVTQAAPDCEYSLSPTSHQAGGNGGSATVSVRTAGHCAWTAESEDSWISIAGGESGTGNGTVRFNVSANPGGERTGELRIAGEAFRVTQAPSACSYTLSHSTFDAGTGGGAGTVSVASAGHCTWTAASNVPWVTLTGGASGSGNGVVGFNVLPNTGPARTGTLTIAGRTFTVNQLAVPCTYQIAPASQQVAAAGTSGTIAVTTEGTCNWGASSNAPWIALTGAISGTGNGSVAYTVAPNDGNQRSGTVTVAGQTFTVLQAAVACSYVITPSGGSVGPAGGSGTFAVAAGGTCTWTAVSGAPWLSVTSGSPGTGNGIVTFSALPNAGDARTGAITVNGQVFTVTQDAAPCTYGITPSEQQIAAEGGIRSFAVTAGGTCTWTAVSNAGWLTVTSGAGTGPGNVTFTVAANPAEARTGTITVANQTFTVTQAAVPPPVCTYTLTPTSQTMLPQAGTGAVTVTAGPTCAWTAASDADWLTVTSGVSGTGTGTVTFTVAENAGAPRNGTIMIAGQAFTVTQSGPPVP
jgi:hypothetical protein